MGGGGIPPILNKQQIEPQNIGESPKIADSGQSPAPPH